MKKRYVILTILVLALIIIFSNYAPAQTTKEPPLTKEQIEAFRSAKIVRLGIKQSYGLAEGASFPFEKFIQKIFGGYAHCEVVGLYASEYDLTIKIDAMGQALSRKYFGEHQLSPGNISYGTWTCYTGAALSGTIEIEVEGLPPYTKTFSEKITPPMAISTWTRTKPSNAPFRRLTRSYISTLLEMAGEIYGVDFIIAAHKESVGMAEGLNSWPVHFRESAIDALVNIRDRAVEPVVAVLNDEDKSVRLFSVEVLGKIKDSRAVEPLISVLNDKNVNVRMLAAEVLGQMGDPRAVEFLISSLRDKNPEVRLKVVEILGEMKDPRAVVPLIETMEDKGNKVRIAAATALGQMKEPRAVETLIFWLKTKSPSFREAVISALGNYDDDRTIELLTAAMNDENRNRRTCVAAALGRMDDPRVVEPLVNALINEKDKGIQWYIAFEVFAKMQEPLAVERLISALKDAEKRNVGNIVGALQGMTKQRFGNNSDGWEAWWAENKDNFAKQKEEEKEEEGAGGIIKKKVKKGTGYFLLNSGTFPDYFNEIIALRSQLHADMDSIFFSELVP